MLFCSLVGLLPMSRAIDNFGTVDKAAIAKSYGIDPEGRGSILVGI